MLKWLSLYQQVKMNRKETLSFFAAVVDTVWAAAASVEDGK
jgi:hypothetical protein